MDILITGASGLIGTALSSQLGQQGHAIGKLSRTPHPGQPWWDIERGIIEWGDYTAPDVVIHLAGENIAGRWTRRKKRRIVDSRTDSTRLLVEHLLTAKQKPGLLISASAIGYYGDRGDEIVDEDSPPGTGFSSEICLPWEAAAQPAVDAGIRVVNIRTGIVLSPRGGALAKMLPAFRLGLGGRIGNGRQYMSWVSIDDYIRMIDFIITQPTLSGPVNMVTPNPVNNTDFTHTLAQTLHRPSVLPMPAFAVRFLFGQMGQELLLGSTRVIPKRLLDAGFEWQFPELGPALRHLLQQP